MRLAILALVLVAFALVDSAPRSKKRKNENQYAEVEAVVGELLDEIRELRKEVAASKQQQAAGQVTEDLPMPSPTSPTKRRGNPRRPINRDDGNQPEDDRRNWSGKRRKGVASRTTTARPLSEDDSEESEEDEEPFTRSRPDSAKENRRTPAQPEERKKNKPEMEAEPEDAADKNKESKAPEEAVKVEPEGSKPEKKPVTRNSGIEDQAKETSPKTEDDVDGVPEEVKPKPAQQKTKTPRPEQGQEDADIINIETQPVEKQGSPVKNTKSAEKKMPSEAEILEDEEITKNKWDNPGGFPVPVGASV